jgi:glutaminyl-peptide cyclotransferase
MKKQIIILVILVMMMSACEKTLSETKPKNSNTSVAMKKDIPTYTYEVVKTYKHDSKAFTQGLFFHNQMLYESTGETGKSNIRKVELENGKVLKQFDLPREIFGEGSTILNDKIYQISWQNNKAFVYDLNFKLLQEFAYEGEGWGLTNDGKNLILSDGTHLLKFIDPETFKTIRTMPIFKEAGKPLFLINELEFVKGEIWANIWQSEQAFTQTTQGTMENIGKPNYVARIDSNTGNVVGWIDLDKISPEDSEEDYANSLNGIAYDAATERIFVTGKNWKNLFEIKIKPKN